MKDEEQGPVEQTTATPPVTSSPLHRIKQAPAEHTEDLRAVLENKVQDRRYWVRLNVSPLGWVALVEHNDTGMTSALGDVLDLGAGGCVMMLYAVPPGLLREHQEITVSLRVSREQVVTCVAEVLSWQHSDNGVQLRLSFTTSDPQVQKQLNDIAYAARVRLLQLSHGEE